MAAIQRLAAHSAATACLGCASSSTDALYALPGPLLPSLTQPSHALPSPAQTSPPHEPHEPAEALPPARHQRSTGPRLITHQRPAAAVVDCQGQTSKSWRRVPNQERSGRKARNAYLDMHWNPYPQHVLQIRITLYASKKASSDESVGEPLGFR